MNPSTADPSACVYVVRLHPSERCTPERLSGRLEHVISGRRHDFDNGAALLACLVHEQTQVAPAQPSTLSKRSQP